MANLADLTQYLQDSITTPLLEQDPVYQDLKDLGIELIIRQIIRQRGYTIDTLPPREEEIVILLAKKEVYMRLATNVAPEWDIETQYTKLLKATRFDHYIKLVATVQDDIIILQKNGLFNFVEANEMYISARNGYARNYQLAPAQYPVLKVSNITSTTADMIWNQFDATISRFSAYELFIGKDNLYDPFEDQVIQKASIVNSYYVVDGRKVNLRVKNLKPSTHYHALLVFRATNLRSDYSQIQFTTLA